MREVDEVDLRGQHIFSGLTQGAGYLLRRDLFCSVTAAFTLFYEDAKVGQGVICGVGNTSPLDLRFKKSVQDFLSDDFTWC